MVAKLCVIIFFLVCSASSIAETVGVPSSCAEKRFEPHVMKIAKSGRGVTLGSESEGVVTRRGLPRRVYVEVATRNFHLLQSVSCFYGYALRLDV